jgi:hypothetical protein
VTILPPLTARNLLSANKDWAKKQAAREKGCLFFSERNNELYIIYKKRNVSLEEKG